MEPIVIVHGGAGWIPNERNQGRYIGIVKAARAGYKKIKETDSALDAVEAAVRSMEDDEAFNAGYGSVLNTEGDVVMCSSIMDGKDLKIGLASLIKDIQYPITLARTIMEKSRHRFLAGDGLMKFAREQGFETLPAGQLVSDFARKSLAELNADQEANAIIEGKHYGEVGTVGAVAIDSKGNIAVATSTGGVCGKEPGRVGDTPVLGCGTYADNRFGGVSTTGDGDLIMPYNLAHEIVKRIHHLDEDASAATLAGLRDMKEKLNTEAGAISIDRDGKMGIHWNTEKMSWAYGKNDEIHYGMWPGEDLVAKVEENEI